MLKLHLKLANAWLTWCQLSKTCRSLFQCSTHCQLLSLRPNALRKLHWCFHVSLGGMQPFPWIISVFDDDTVNAAHETAPDKGLYVWASQTQAQSLADEAGNVCSDMFGNAALVSALMCTVVSKSTCCNTHTAQFEFHSFVFYVWHRLDDF